VRIKRLLRYPVKSLLGEESAAPTTIVGRRRLLTKD
jgi:hypothetical protein